MKNVLLIDNDPMIARTLARMIGSTAIAMTAGDMDTALMMLTQTKFDVVVCDLRDGIDFNLSKAISGLPYKSPRLVFMTTIVTEARRFNAAALGASLIDKISLSNVVLEVFREEEIVKQWQVGPDGRTIYDENGNLVGMMDTRELAEQVVKAVNSAMEKK